MSSDPISWLAKTDIRMSIAVTGDFQHRLEDVDSGYAATRIFAGKAERRCHRCRRQDQHKQGTREREAMKSKSALPCRVAAERKYSSDEIVRGATSEKFLSGIVSLFASAFSR